MKNNISKSKKKNFFKAYHVASTGPALPAADVCTAAGLARPLAARGFLGISAHLGAGHKMGGPGLKQTKEME